jgi:hypothetical protein
MVHEAELEQVTEAFRREVDALIAQHGRDAVVQAALLLMPVGPNPNWDHMPLVLRRANLSRKGGHWDDDDFDVYDGEREVGRVYRVSGDASRCVMRATVSEVRILPPCALLSAAEKKVPRERSPSLGGIVSGRDGRTITDSHTRWLRKCNSQR